MDNPVVAQKAPYKIELEEGKRYFWCACGRSQKQPYCDGSHKGTGFAPLMYEAKKSGDVWFCGCKQSKKKPFCDGTHSSL